MAEKEIEINGQNIQLSNIDKIFFPKLNFSKGDVIEYYQKISETMLPHIKHRPISMQRFPDGIEEFNFYEKEAPDYFPDWIEKVDIEVKENNQKQKQVVVNDTATLVYLANQACLIPHIWLSKKDKLDFPDKLIFDLDPPSGNDFSVVKQGARLIKDFLENLGLPSYVMTTGSRGLHVVLPLDRKSNFDHVREFGHNLAEKIAEQNPDSFTTETRKNKRGGKVFLDYLRNAYGQTSVPPYAIRAIHGAPIATPLDWEELQDNDLSAQTYTVENIFRRLGQKKDPWQDFFAKPNSIRKARESIKD